MDFFEAQARARRRTGRLVVLFTLAVVGTIVALYFAYVSGTGLLGLRSTASGGSIERYPGLVGGDLSRIDWWQPGALKTIALIVLPTIGLGALWKWWSFRAGGPAVAEDVGGVRVEPGTTDLRQRTLHNIVEEMSLASGLPVPAVYVLPGESGINAFAAGYTQADAAVAVTRGSLESLSRDELQGVVAHEFSHILNGDMRLNTRLVALLYGILSLVLLGRALLRIGVEIARDGGGSGKKNGGGLAVPFFLGGLALYVIGGIGFLFGRLIQAAVSRQREHLADASAVQFTRNPSGLVGALRKIGGSDFGARLACPAAGEISHFCFAQNFRSDFAGLFATHPPLEERIRALDPAWDGRFAASPSPAHAAAASYELHPDFDAPVVPLAAQPARVRIDPAELIGAAGRLSPQAVTESRELLAALPDALRDAAHSPAQASALCLALCLPEGDATALTPLLELIATQADTSSARETARLHALLAEVPTTHHLALLQLAAPALRQLDETAAATLLVTLDALVRADGQISIREFALQRVVARTLGLAARPRDAIHVLAPNQVGAELSLALSVAARLEAGDDPTARAAFARAAAEFNGLQPPLAYRADGEFDWDRLDEALDHLAHTPAPFRKRVLHAFATALTADARLGLDEADLLRAFAAALDCPLPPVLPVSA